MKSATCFHNGFESSISCGTNAYPSSGEAHRRAFLTVSGLLFAASATVTVLWCNSMSAMGEMPMPGGWTMSMTWMRLPGRSWIETTALFLAMWLLMMTAMMLPSLVPMLARYRQAVGPTNGTRLQFLTALAGIGYFFVWILLGVAVFPIGATLAALEMERPAVARAVPFAVGAAILIAGAVQLTSWKAHHLACCREMPARDCTLPADGRTAWRQGLRLGFHCGLSCANLTMALLVLGVMDLRAMTAVTVAITAERLLPADELVAQVIGTVAIGTGMFLITQAGGRA